MGKNLFVSILILTVFLFSKDMLSQSPIGRLDDHMALKSYYLYFDGTFIEVGNPMNRFKGLREPSGQMFLMLPSFNPMYNSYYIDWNNNLVHISPASGANIIGTCFCPAPPNPYANIYNPPTFKSRIGIRSGNQFYKTPVEFAKSESTFATPLISSEEQAKSCLNDAINPYTGEVDQNQFKECMLRSMIEESDLKVYDCVKNSATDEERALCLFEKLGGKKEAEIAQKLKECYSAYGSDYSKYPLCLGSDYVGNDDIGKVIACMEQQSRTGDISFYGTAICYGADSFDLNPETQIILECAVSSGGEPYTFAGCAGGRLTAREIQKCLDNGIGGKDGCFGDNNDIVKAYRQIGDMLKVDLGENNDIAKYWNNAIDDMTRGPGPNNDIVKTVRNLGNEIERTSKKAGKTLEKLLPRITF